MLRDRNCGPMLDFPDTELGTDPEWQAYTTAAPPQVCLFFLGNEFSAPVGNCTGGWGRRQVLTRLLQFCLKR